MTPFEQFVAQEYGRKQGDDVSDIYDEARSRWRQMRTQPAEAFTPNAQAVNDPDAQTRQAQEMFASLSNNPAAPAGATVDLSRAQEADLRTPVAEPYGGSFDLLTPANRTVFDDLPDSGGLRQEQAREMEIAQRQASGGTQATTAEQPQGLPDDLVNQVWRGFSQDYLDFSRRVSGAMKSADRKQLIDDWNNGFANNYAPVFGMTLSEAESVARKAAEENRRVQTTDWKMGQETASATPTLDIKQMNDVITAADGLVKLGREKEAQELLVKAGIAKPENDLNNALGILDENSLLQAAKKAGRYTAPDGTVYDGDAIEERLAKNNETLVGLRPVLARTPSVEGKVLNIRDLEPEHISEKGVNISAINRDVAARAEKSPGLLVVSQSGELMPAETFKYELLRKGDAEGGGLALGLADRGYDASGRGVARLAKDAVRGSVEGLRKANEFAANTLYQGAKSVASGDVNVTTIPGVGVPARWLRDFTNELTGSEEEDEDSK
jgi:hypothetical protein